jgi:hypothetical protein
MSRKFSDLEQTEKKHIENELEAVSSSMGMEAYETYGNREGSLLQDQIGMCHNCKNLSYCKTEFGNVFAKCSEFEFRLNGQNRIEECNLHCPRHSLSLNEMYTMAYLIDPKDEKIKGFISTDKRFMKTKKKRSLPLSKPLQF